MSHYPLEVYNPRISDIEVKSTTAETELSSFTLKSMPLTGNVYRIFAGGSMKGGASQSTFRYRAYAGGSVIMDTADMLFKGTSVESYNVILDITVRLDGLQGVIQANGNFRFSDSSVIVNSNVQSINLSQSPAIKTTVQMSSVNSEFTERSANLARFA